MEFSMRTKMKLSRRELSSTDMYISSNHGQQRGDSFSCEFAPD